MNLSDLPAVNACLNSLSAIFLTAGYYFIRRKNQMAHRNCMLSAFATSTLFLICYLIYHFYAGRTVFKEPAWFRPINLTILLTHTLLAVVILPRAKGSAGRAARSRPPGACASTEWSD